jgi:hypothetical protein
LRTTVFCDVMCVPEASRITDPTTWFYIPEDQHSLINSYTGYTQKNSAVSKVNKKFISHFARAQRTPTAATTIQVFRALPIVRLSCLLRGQF